MSVQPLSRVDVVDRVDELLELSYRSEDLGNAGDPLAETVFIMLSRQTQGPVFRRTFAALRERFPTWVSVLNAEAAEVQGVLSPGGLYVQRSGQLQSLLKVVLADNASRGVGPAGSPPGDLTLDYLRDMQPGDALKFLVDLPGIGEKSARCVMSYALSHDTFAVDTHIRRIFDRLGLVPYDRGKVDHGPYDELVPRKMRTRLHVNLIHHGRATCLSERPRCGDCVLVSFCAEGRERLAQSEQADRRIVDLCSGVGGLSEGFAREGFEPAAAVELDRDAAQSFRANHPGVPVLEADVTSLQADELAAFTTAAIHPAAVVSGTPCQGYSAAGARNPGDPRNSMYKHVIRLSQDLGAKVAILENVPGLKRVNGTGFLDDILSALQHAFGWADRYLLTASDFGVPQNRQRYFFVAGDPELLLLSSKNGGPEPTHLPAESPANPSADLPQTPSLKEALAGLPELGAGVEAEWLVRDGKVFLNASTMGHSARVIEKIADIEQGEGPISYRRLEDIVARTLVAGHRALPVHPWLDRTISVREAARIQGFEDSYVFAGTRSNQPLQVANAVPPLLASAVARHVRSLLGLAADAAMASVAQTRT